MSEAFFRLSMEYTETEQKDTGHTDQVGSDITEPEYTEQEPVTLRRKGRPRGEDIEPLEKKLLRSVCFWILFTGVAVFLIMLWLWALHNIRLVTEGTRAVAELAAGTVDVRSVETAAQELLRIRADAPQKATGDYTADEQVVLLARYEAVEQCVDWQTIDTGLSELSGHYAYAAEFSMVLLDTNSQQLIWLAGPGHKTGYAAWLSDIALPGEEGYDLKDFAGHKEGTMVLQPIRMQTGEIVTLTAPDGGTVEVYIGGMFSFAGIMNSEMKKLLIPLIVTALALLCCSLRILWIVYKKQGLGTSRDPQPDDYDDGIPDHETIKHME